jgi:hypothetical protein
MAMNKEEKRRFLKALARANNEYVNRQKRQAMQKVIIKKPLIQKN